jgi:hypothetical protein
MSVEKVVQQQIEFYNNQDLDGFASTYADDITVHIFPDNTIILNGKQALFERYTETFKKKMYAEIKNRSIVGNKVIDWEIVTNGLTGESTSLMAIYEVDGNLISKVWFIKEYTNGSPVVQFNKKRVIKHMWEVVLINQSALTEKHDSYGFNEIREGC